MKASDELEVAKKYEKIIYDYVQGTGNTSSKTLGLHVAEALVMDHKELKAKLAQAEAEIERLNRVIAKELSENDELGAEYTYVNALKAKLQQAEAEIERLNKDCISYFLHNTRITAVQNEFDRLFNSYQKEREISAMLREALEKIQSLAANEHDLGDSKALDEVFDVTCQTFGVIGREMRGSERGEE